MAEAVLVPDESGMAEYELRAGEVYFDPDCGHEMVFLDRNRARPATEREVAEHYRHQFSESGHGWTTDGMYPFFPGIPCVHCGRFVGRNGIFNVEHFEMSSEVASVDAEHRDCSRREDDERRARRG